MISVKTPSPNKVTLWGLGLQQLDPGGTMRLVTAPQPSAALPPAPVCLGSSLTARPGPVRRVRNGPPPDPSRSRHNGCWGRRAPRTGEGQGEGASLCSLSAPPPVHPQVRLRGLLGPRGASARPPVVLPDAIGTASVPGPPAWCCPAGRPCPRQPRPLRFAQALRPRRSPASCQGVTVSPPEPRTAPLGIPAALYLPLSPSQVPSPHSFLCCPLRSWGLGSLGSLVQL